MKIFPSYKLLLIMIISLIIVKNNIVVFLFIIILILNFSALIFNKKLNLTLLKISVLVMVFVSFFSLRKVEALPERVIEKKVEIFGIVKTADIPNKKYLEFEIILDSVAISDDLLIKPNENRILIRKYFNKSQIKDSNDTIFPGSYIIAKGTFKDIYKTRNIFDFNYGSYLKNEGISGYFLINNDDIIVIKTSSNLSSFIFKIRLSISNKIQSVFNESNSDLIHALILGEGSFLSDNIKNKFKDTGVYHLLVVSGLHVSVIAYLIFVVSGRTKFHFRLISVMILLFFFMFITGLKIPIIRAVIMFMVFGISFIFERIPNKYNNLSIAAIFTILIFPFSIFNVGFQLSFLAVLSLFISSDLCFKLFHNNIKNFALRMIIEYLFSFLLLYLFISPLLLLYFNKLSFLSLLGNIILLPLTGLYLISAIVILLLAYLNIFIFRNLANSLEVLYEIKLYVLHKLSEIKFATIENYGITSFQIIIAFLLVFFFIFLSKSKNRLFIIKNFLLISVIQFQILRINVFEILHKNDSLVFFPYIGQGDAAIIKTGDSSILIDAGNKTDYFDSSEIIKKYMSLAGLEKINIGIISHIDRDHYGGFLNLINNNLIEKIIKTKVDSTNNEDELLTKFIISKNIEIISSNNDILLGKLKLVKLNSFLSNNENLISDNQKSLVYKCFIENSSILFTGDADSLNERVLINNYGDKLKSDILKVSHHGSSSSSSQNFLKLVNPDFAVISAGLGNSYGHPANEVVMNLKKLNTSLFITFNEAIIFNISNAGVEKIDF